MRRLSIFLVNTALSGIFFLGVQPAVTAQDSSKATPKKSSLLPPGQTARGFLTPTGWGSRQSMAYAFLAGTFPQVYSRNSDLLAGIGTAWGDTCHALGVRLSLNINDVSEFDQFSGNLIWSLRLDNSSSISAGGLHLAANRALSDAAPTFYISFSHAVQTLRQVVPGVASLSYTIGVGNGRFYTMSKRDRELGRWQHGTAVFGSLSASITKNLVITAEWTGHNVCISTNWRPYIPTRLPFRLPSLSLGLADPFRFTGEHLRLVAALSYGFALPWPKTTCTP